jgi:3-oxoacyl-[acyl-carrier-protein] synthase-3
MRRVKCLESGFANLYTEVVLIGIPAIQYALPESRVTLAELETAGQLESPGQRLQEFGFQFAHVSKEPAESLAKAAVAALLKNHAVAAESVDAIFYAGAIPASHFVGEPGGAFLSGFNYPASKIQYEFGLLNAVVTGISQVGCLGLMTAVKTAADYLSANIQGRRALCVSADVFPRNAKREVIYNLISDGACALLVEREPAINRILAHRQITKGFYWDSVGRKNEIIAAYFPTAKHIVGETLAQAGLKLEDIAWVIPHNVSRRSWEILVGLLGLPKEKLWAENIAAKGHVIAADNFINLKDAAESGALQRGDKLLLFNFGFGANWGCMIVEH